MGHLFLTVYDLEAQGQTRAAARELMACMLDLVFRGDFKAVNEILRTIDLTKLSTRSLTALVRCVFANRGALPDWQQTYERCWRLCWERGDDPKRLYIGLQDLSYLKQQ